MLGSVLHSPIGELMIIVLDNPSKSELNIPSHLIFSLPQKATIENLKHRIAGVTSIPIDRLVLLFCGQLLVDTMLIPSDSFELTDMADEDTNLCRARLCLYIQPPPDIDAEDEDEVSEIEEESIAEESGTTEARHKQKRVNKLRDLFHLDSELADIECAPYYDSLKKAGYDNEGAFACLEIETLRGPGFWIPLRFARKINELSKQVGQRILERDKSHYNSRLVVEQALVEQHKINTVAIDDSGTSGEYTKKADLRRAWEAKQLKQKKEAAQKQWDEEHPRSAYKDHAPALQKKIHAIRTRCMREAAEAEEDFDEITNIIYRHPRMNVPHGGVGTGTNTSTSPQQRWPSTNDDPFVPAATSPAPVNTPSQDSSAKSPQKGRSRHQLNVQQALRSTSAASILQRMGGTTTSTDRKLNSTQTAYDYQYQKFLRDNVDTTTEDEGGTTGINTSGDQHALHFPDRALMSQWEVVDALAVLDKDAGTSCCCPKHRAALMRTREHFVALRRQERSLTLMVQLDRLSSSGHGYATSGTLSAVASYHLRAYGGIPRRSMDPALIATCLNESVLDLEEQRRIVLGVQHKEAHDENLLSVLPVLWYSPTKFVEVFTALLEELDHERLVNAN